TDVRDWPIARASAKSPPRAANSQPLSAPSATTERLDSVFEGALAAACQGRDAIECAADLDQLRHFAQSVHVRIFEISLGDADLGVIDDGLRRIRHEHTAVGIAQKALAGVGAIKPDLANLLAI